jgi:hypothetical protein
MLMDQIFPSDLSIVKLLVTIIGLSTFCLDLEKLNGNVAIKEECAAIKPTLAQWTDDIKKKLSSKEFTAILSRFSDYTEEKFFFNSSSERGGGGIIKFNHFV